MAQSRTAQDAVKPARRIGTDWVEDYVSEYGLHVLHIYRSLNVPDVNAWLESYPQARSWIYIDDEGTGHLWLAWKEHAKK